MSSSQSSTVILGAGIMGVSTAYYLSHSGNTSPESIHIVDASPQLFECASGRAAGFVAEDWFAPKEASLGALSFRLHKELADENDGRSKWGYCSSTATFVVEGKGKELEDPPQIRDDGSPRWLKKKKGGKLEKMSGRAGKSTTAQVQPLALCQFLLDQSTRRGVTLHHPAKAVSVICAANGRIEQVNAVMDSGQKLSMSCTRLIITCGAWTPHVFSMLFPSSKVKLRISPLAGYSLVVRSPQWTGKEETDGCHAVFADDTDDLSPAIFSRLGEEIYVSGLNDFDDKELPERSTESRPKKEFLNRLDIVAKRMLGQPDELEVLKENMCYQPVTPRGTPIVSRVPDDKLGDGLSTAGSSDGGVFVAAGHGHWGISLSLGTGKVVSEMVEDKPVSANIKSLGV